MVLAGFLISRGSEKLRFPKPTAKVSNPLLCKSVNAELTTQ